MYQTFAERLAATLATAPAVERFPTGKPQRRDVWSHVAGRGHAAPAPVHFARSARHAQ